jgi:citrate lyase subunit beta/citryl-CoA lyase
MARHEEIFGSLLYVPGVNERALEKARKLPVRAVIFDLEDAVAQNDKGKALANVLAALKGDGWGEKLLAVRVNRIAAARTADMNAGREASRGAKTDKIANAGSGAKADRGEMDEAAKDELTQIVKAGPRAILLPKIESAGEVIAASELIESVAARENMPPPRLWLMIESARALLQIGEIAALAAGPSPALEAFILGVNDIALDTGTRKEFMTPWFMQTILAARAHNLAIIDAVCNDFRDMERLAEECERARNMGMDGKSLIHPAQIDICNAAFAPSRRELARARRIIGAFEKSGDKGANVLALDGEMVERLHYDMAKALLRRAEKMKIYGVAESGGERR